MCRNLAPGCFEYVRSWKWLQACRCTIQRYVCRLCGPNELQTWVVAVWLKCEVIWNCTRIFRIIGIHDRPNKVVGDYYACSACDSGAPAACTEFYSSGPSGGFHSLSFMFDFVLVLQKPYQANGGHQGGQRGSSSWPETVAGNGFKLMYPLRISKCHLFWRNLSTKAGRVSTHRGGVYVGTAARTLILM